MTDSLLFSIYTGFLFDVTLVFVFISNSEQVTNEALSHKISRSPDWPQTTQLSQMIILLL